MRLSGSYRYIVFFRCRVFHASGSLLNRPDLVTWRNSMTSCVVCRRNVLMGKWIMGCDCNDLRIPDKKDRNRILYPVVCWQTHLKSRYGLGLSHRVRRLPLLMVSDQGEEHYERPKFLAKGFLAMTIPGASRHRLSSGVTSCHEYYQ